MDVAGGAPLLGEPLPIELANTAYAVRGQPRDGLQTTAHLAAWLGEVASGEVASSEMRTTPTTADLATARRLRDAIRTIAAAIVRGDQPDDAAVAILNLCAVSTRQWRELQLRPDLHVVPRTDGTHSAAVLSRIATDAIELFGGPLRTELRACAGPGCVLFFLKDRPRREWCSPGCGNRARAARHYARARESGPTS
ncbi:CGNR zinc finger domain-containing protein [Antrihabitans sp. YC3-6]|uniref:CGNR zinc finger domain-containing protein n=1 Tax=Antrihabitans stalagmiti TaxID=2799499 RepID=A0A934NNM1_9NOCA|nr:CGNR zinc finger domain-containing protein [Antrihabitans stalagmiti]MBJ8338541.1 CGNR zinc finger domain-containing protein [Antrihabitans stalagmiti]